MEVRMRRAKKIDAEAINYIFNQAVEDGNSTLDIDLKNPEYRMHWLAAHDRRHPVYVGEVAGEVVCWVALSPHSPRYSYDFVAELSIYVRRDFRGKGLGSLLMKFIEQRAGELGYYKLVISVYAENRSALHAYRRAGYRDVGIFRNHGYHKGRLVDIIFMERLLTPDMEFLKKHYGEKYPFYAEFFAKERAEEEAILRRNGMLDDLYEEVPVEDPSGLPDGIVRFLRSKGMDETSVGGVPDGENQDEDEAAVAQSTESEAPDTNEELTPETAAEENEEADTAEPAEAGSDEDIPDQLPEEGGDAEGEQGDEPDEEQDEEQDEADGEPEEPDVTEAVQEPAADAEESAESEASCETTDNNASGPESNQPQASEPEGEDDTEPVLEPDPEDGTAEIEVGDADEESEEADASEVAVAEESEDSENEDEDKNIEESENEEPENEESELEKPEPEEAEPEEQQDNSEAAEDEAEPREESKPDDEFTYL